jgi:hypothetical protein
MWKQRLSKAQLSELSAMMHEVPLLAHLGRVVVDQSAHQSELSTKATLNKRLISAS